MTTRHVSALNSVVHADLRAKLIAAQGERDAVEAEALDFNRRVMARVDTLELGLEDSNTLWRGAGFSESDDDSPSTMYS